jgi:hypothetical protein
MPTSLIFVYNADSGLFNTVTDIAHKILSPRTYTCQLCALTHGYFSVRQEWVGFLESLQIECQFLHRDEFKQTYQQDADELPAIFLHNGEGKLELFADKRSIEACNDLDALKTLLREKLQRLNLITLGAKS